MSARRRDAGQATVEFALTLPIVIIVALGLLQVGIAIRNELAVELAAREGARAAAVSTDPGGAASAAARRAVALPIGVAATEGGGTVTVTVTYIDPTDVAIIGRFIGPSTHTATITMAIEPP
ncbi:MAG: pilus assembly protein [Ilumatobacter sp.]|nr:pilus assembly protein [Ilumatobacter sp.]